jgi:hypothetical protein
MMGLLVGAGCASVELVVEPADDVATVASVRWTGVDDTSRVVVADARGDILASELQPAPAGGAADEVAVTLVGLPAATDLTARVETGNATSEEVSFQTGALPGSTPTWDMEGSAEFDGLLSIAAMDDDAMALVLDRKGGVRWYHEEPSSHILRTRPTVDGEGVIYNAFLLADDQDPVTPILVRVAWDGTEHWRRQIDTMTHDFVELADGTIAYLEKDRRAVPGLAPGVTGNRLVEVAPDGGERVVFSIWEVWDPTVDGEVEADGDWTHANALSIDADESRYTIGFYGPDAIVEVDRATGQPLRQIGGPHSDYVMGEGATFVDQHQFRWLAEDRLLLFDNGTVETSSRALQLVLDDQEGTASVEWEWQRDPPLWSAVLGDVERLEGGATLIDWSANGVLSEVGPDGAERWSMSLGMAHFFGFVVRFPEIRGTERLR